MSAHRADVILGGATISVLLVEDDDGDALLVEDLLDRTRRVELERCRTISDAIACLTAGVDCVLLDLNLPDGVGVESVRRILAVDPSLAVVVFTGIDNEELGEAAVAAGAQDYLVKGSVESQALLRAIRYAVVRRQADNAAQQLRVADLRAQENARLERGLVPLPILRNPEIWVALTYLPGRQDALLSGDFYDVVERDAGAVHVIIGDVVGHGPDAAALGATLRIAWRALTLAGIDADEVLSSLDRLIEHERHSTGVFATLCMLCIEPERGAVIVRRAGHLPPMVIAPGEVRSLPAAGGGPPIGMFPASVWESVEHPLPAEWSILLYTDGLIETTRDGASGRLGEGGLERLITERIAADGDWCADPDAFLGRLASDVIDASGRPLRDDVAMVLIGNRRPSR